MNSHRRRLSIRSKPFITQQGLLELRERRTRGNVRAAGGGGRA